MQTYHLTRTMLIAAGSGGAIARAFSRGISSFITTNPLLFTTTNHRHHLPPNHLLTPTTRHIHRTTPTMSTKRKKKTTTTPPSPSIPHLPPSLLPSYLPPERTRHLTSTSLQPNTSTGKCIIYWMQRDMRTRDNWSLLLATHLSQKLQLPLRVAYVPPSPSSLPQPYTARYVAFLTEGLKDVEEDCRRKSIPLDVILGSKNDGNRLVDRYCSSDETPAAIVCDMSPLRHFRREKDRVAPLLESLSIPLYQVDSHNVVPVWHASDKREVGARTLRKKIDARLPEFMTTFPKWEVEESCRSELEEEGVDWDEVEAFLEPDGSVPPVKGFVGGYEAAKTQFKFFLDNGLKKYDTLRNDPNNPHVISNMSPWVNFGHVSFQRLALAVRQLGKYPNGTAAFIEEGVVRRELSDNFLFYTEDYDSLEGAAAGWARESLELHAGDEREWVFTKEELEGGMTHDDLWNASQLQLMKEGKLHGFLRMYWAKKILEWTPSPQLALQYAQYFNDKYALDGNDPNGFVGVGWSIMGIHDMGWKERPIFGKIRFMNYAGCKRKFKVDDFVKRYPPAKENAMRVLKRKEEQTKKGSKVTSLSGKKRKSTKT